VTDYLAGQRFLSLIESGTAPESVLRDAAQGQLSLPLGDRLVILVYLAEHKNGFQSEAQKTLYGLDQTQVAEVVSDPACPDEIRRYVEQHASDLSPEERELLALAEQETGSFELLDATAEERLELEGKNTASAKDGDETLLQRVARMTVPQRVQLALRGNRDERLLLVRDGNKVVQRAVVASPRLTDNDAEMIANMRNVTDEVLRNIAADRRFRKSMAVVRNIVANPKTPADASVPLLKHLIAKDLRHLTMNKNVADVVRRMAAKTLEAKSKGR
jgi:hypothetical protein